MTVNNRKGSLITRTFLQVDARSTLRLLFSLFLICISITYLAFVAPGKSYIGVWLNDVMGLLDVAYRVHVGEVLYRDFQFSYGPLVAIIPAFGLDVGLDAGSIFGFEGLISSVVLLATAMIALPRRLTAASATLVFLYVWLLTVVPIGDAQPFSRISWGTFYNRQGWAAIFLILLFYIEPIRIERNTKWMDSVALATLVLFEIYLKFTFGAVALSFVFANAVVSRYNRDVATRSLIIILSVAGALELIFHFHAAYLHSIVVQSHMMNGAAFSFWTRIFPFLVSNFALLLGCLGAALVLWLTGHRSMLVWIYVAGAIGATFLLRLTVGASGAGWITALPAILVVLGELARRTAIHDSSSCGLPLGYSWNGHSVYFGCFSIVLIFILPEVLNRVIAMEDFVVKINRVHALPNLPKKLDSFLVPDSGVNDAEGISTKEYMKTISDGANLLLSLNKKEKSVLTFDMVNPFPYVSGMRPPVYGYPLFWMFGASYTADPKRLPSSGQLFGGVDYVMVPRSPYQAEQLENMQRVYGAYLTAHFYILKESTYWQLWQRL